MCTNVATIKFTLSSDTLAPRIPKGAELRGLPLALSTLRNSLTPRRIYIIKETSGNYCIGRLTHITADGIEITPDNPELKAAGRRLFHWDQLSEVYLVKSGSWEL